MNVVQTLTNQFHKEFKDSFSKDELSSYLESIGGLEEKFKSSTGVHLELSWIRIIGEKDDQVEGEFIYEREFYPGINTLISDNLKGKSTILKCIKLALTGKNSLQSNMSRWINLILLEFKLGSLVYLVEVDNSGLRIKATLSKASMEDYDAKSIQDIDVKFSAKNSSQFESMSENFFYEQLGISSLKWTQKASQKNKNELLEAGTSWKTFYKTIYLESKDTSSLLFGAQADLLMQILLGLSLTTPMNRLKVTKDFLEFNAAKAPSAQNNESKSPERLLSEIEIELSEMESELEVAIQVSNNEGVTKLLKLKSESITELQICESKKMELLKDNYEWQERNRSINKSLADLDGGLDQLSREKLALEKRRIQMREHIDIGSFFSNLDLKCCPSCNNNLADKQRVNSNQNSCSLCDHSVKNTDRQEDVTRLETKISIIDETIVNLENLEKLELGKKEETALKLSNHMKNRSQEDILDIENAIESLTVVINDFATEIAELLLSDDEKVEEIKFLESKIAVLKYRKLEIEDQNESDTPDENGEVLTLKKIQLLDKAIIYLQELRGSQNLAIIEKLKELILKVLSEIGLDSFTNIEINPKLKIFYTKAGETTTFDDITEGEQLRVKVAMYLALVLLNSEHSVGNHPRLLMIDSPGKEEADDTYFEGLIHSLENIENNYSEKIQILIGSADRRLVGVVDNKKQEVKAHFEAFF